MGEQFIPEGNIAPPYPFGNAEPDGSMVIALANHGDVPVDTLGIRVEDASFGEHNELTLIDWYIDGPGQPTRRVMMTSEYRIINEG